MRDRVYHWIHRVWYEDGRGYWWLLPFAAMFWVLSTLRRSLYRAGALKRVDVGVPVIVVGNLTVGGTGKTPTTIWLAAALAERGFAPGIVSRGYGGSGSGSPMRVDAASDPRLVGDEPVLLARRSGCPVAVDSNRVRAAAMLVEDGADVIIADDGLQHLKLARSYEICVIDGRRWLGNRLLLPAGPLRETASRLADVDQVLVNGRLRHTAGTAAEQNAIECELRATEAMRLNGSLSRPLAEFAGTTVHGVAAIGNPARFFALLRAEDIQVIEHPHPDHAVLTAADLEFGDDFDVLMTEKDAVKIGSRAADRLWYVPVSLHMDPLLAGPWLEQVVSRLESARENA